KRSTVTYAARDGMCRNRIEDAPEKVPLRPVAVAADRLGRHHTAVGFPCPDCSPLGPPGSVPDRPRLPAADRGTDRLPAPDLHRPPSRGTRSFPRPDRVAGGRPFCRSDLAGSALHADVLATVRSGFSKTPPFPASR